MKKKKDPPNLFSSRLIGLYIIIISLLVVLHVKYIEVNGTEKAQYVCTKCMKTAKNG